MENPTNSAKEENKDEKDKSQKLMDNLRKKVRVLEKRYQIVFKTSKTIEELFISNLSNLFDLFKTELFQKETLQEEINPTGDKDKALKSKDIIDNINHTKNIIQRTFQRVEELQKRNINLENQEKERKKQEEQWNQLERDLRADILKSKEEVQEKTFSLERIESLLRQKERTLKDVEQKLNRKEENEHGELIQKLQQIQKKDKDEESERELSNQMDLIIRLREKIRTLKDAKMVIRKEEEEISIHEKDTQTDAIENLNLDLDNHELERQSGSFKHSLESKTITNLSFKEGSKMMPLTSSGKGGNKGKNIKNEDIAEKMYFLSDVVEKYFDYRIKGKDKEEKLTLKVILDALELDLEKKMRIQNHEIKAKKLFKIF